MPDPLYRRTYDAAALLREHPPRFQHPHKAALFDIAYPAGSTPRGTVEVTRWPQHVPDALSLPPTLTTEVHPNFYDYAPTGDGNDAVEWHVNFADPRLFGAYASGLFAQDEMQVVEHPLLASVREALLSEGLPAKTNDATGATPVLVRQVERRIMVATNPDATAGRPLGLYGNRFAMAPFEAIRRATRHVDPPTFSNIVAVAAPAGGHGDYSEREISLIFAAAFTAFDAARGESPRHRAIVHTGFWGCGAFGGNRRLMIALQSLAARAAGITRLVLHAGDMAGADEAQRGLDVADALASRCGNTCSLDTLVGRTALLGYRWGVSDGN